MISQIIADLKADSEPWYIQIIGAICLPVSFYIIANIGLSL